MRPLYVFEWGGGGGGGVIPKICYSAVSLIRMARNIPTPWGLIRKWNDRFVNPKSTENPWLCIILWYHTNCSPPAGLGVRHRQSQYGNYMTPHNSITTELSWMKSLWMFWIGCSCLSWRCSVSGFCDFWKMTFCDFLFCRAHRGGGRQRDPNCVVRPSVRPWRLQITFQPCICL